MFFTAITAKMERIRHASAAIEITPEVNSASTVSTSPENRAAVSPGFCAESVAAESLVSFRDISERSMCVIRWPNISSRVSCAEASTPSNARLPKYSSAALNASGMPPVRLSMIRASTSGGSSEASTEAAAQSTVPTLSSLCLKAASRTAANT